MRLTKAKTEPLAGILSTLTNPCSLIYVKNVRCDIPSEDSKEYCSSTELALGHLEACGTATSDIAHCTEDCQSPLEPDWSRSSLDSRLAPVDLACGMCATDSKMHFRCLSRPRQKCSFRLRSVHHLHVNTMIKDGPPCTIVATCLQLCQQRQE